jgi:hypothetical protein
VLWQACFGRQALVVRQVVLAVVVMARVEHVVKKCHDIVKPYRDV